MKTAVVVLVFMAACLAVEGRSYYRNKVGLCPELHCPYIYIQPGCRVPTYYWSNGQRCTGCDRDGCDRWGQNGGIMGGDRWGQNGGIMGGDRWGQNGGILRGDRWGAGNIGARRAIY